MLNMITTHLQHCHIFEVDGNNRHILHAEALQLYEENKKVYDKHRKERKYIWQHAMLIYNIHKSYE